ncbi:hypothetical protein MRB53_020798 [Persea americana]|nr:hypothetical protein MRB53_020798 [Persea americana]
MSSESVLRGTARVIADLGTSPKCSIASNNFNGSLPPELGNLVNLEQLNMDSSGVGGEIPSTFSNLVNLKIVRASDSPFNGTIPSFIGSWNLTSL